MNVGTPAAIKTGWGQADTVHSGSACAILASLQILTWLSEHQCAWFLHYFAAKRGCLGLHHTSLEKALPSRRGLCCDNSVWACVFQSVRRHSYSSLLPQICMAMTHSHIKLTVERRESVVWPFCLGAELMAQKAQLGIPFWKFGFCEGHVTDRGWSRPV